MNLDSNFVVLDKIPAIRGRQSKIYRLDKAAVIFKVATQDLLRQFVGFQPSLRRDLRELRLFCGLKSYFHGHSLESFMKPVKHLLAD